VAAADRRGGVMDHFVIGLRATYCLARATMASESPTRMTSYAASSRRRRSDRRTRSTDNPSGITGLEYFGRQFAVVIALQKLGHGTCPCPDLGHTMVAVHYRSLDSGYSPVPNFPR